MSASNLLLSGTKVNNFLEYLPPEKIARYPDGPPKNAVPFSGYPQAHPAEKNKLILVYDPLGAHPAVLEFKVDDILYVEDAAQAVTETGEVAPLVKIWIRRGARGMLLEPFEVEDSLRFLETRREQKERVAGMDSDNGADVSPRPART